jgi:hypothetical protein
LLRGIFGICDRSPTNQSSLLYRLHLEGNLLRQFIEKDERLVRFFVPVPLIITDTKPLEPYCNSELTKDISLPDISPMNPFVCLWPNQVYNPEQNFPIKVSLIFYIFFFYQFVSFVFLILMWNIYISYHKIGHSARAVVKWLR